MRNNKSGKKASILVVCLWTIMVLSILGMGLTGLVFQEINFTKIYQRLRLSLPTVRSALKTIFYLREADPTPNFDTFDELAQERPFVLCANNSYKYYFADIKNPAGKNEKGNVKEIIDESALININLASPDVLKRIPGINEDTAEKIINSGLRPFSSVNELLLVEDMKKENFLLFKDMITVYGSGKININTASKAVLLALGLDEQVAEAILDFRQKHKIENPDPDSTKELDYGFSSTAKILDDLRGFTSLGLRQEQDILSLLSVFSVKSEYLRFNIIPFFGSREGLHYSIIIHPATKKILSWREY